MMNGTVHSKLWLEPLPLLLLLLLLLPLLLLPLLLLLLLLLFLSLLLAPRRLESLPLTRTHRISP